MANGYNGLNLTAIADSALANLKRKIGPLKLYTTDFSDAFMAPGQAAVTTRYWTAKTARSFTSSDTTYTRDDSTSTAVTVTPSMLYSLADINELSLSGTPTDLEAQVAAVGGESVVRGMFTTLNALVLNAAYSQKETVTVANFGMDDVIKARKTLMAGGVGGDIHTVVSADGFSSLLGSTTVYPQIQRDTNGNGNILAAFPGIGDVHEVSTVDALGENLYGWTATKDAFCLVARQPMVPKGFAGDVSTSIDSETGLSVQVRSWFDGLTGLHNVWVGSLFGASVGRPASLVRYVTA